MPSLRTYEGTAQFVDRLRYPTFRDLIDDLECDERPFVTWYDQGQRIEAISRHQFGQATRRGAARFLQSGVRRSDMVVAVAGNAPETLVAYASALYMGGDHHSGQPCRRNRDAVVRDR